MDSFLRDLRFAWRMLVKSPGFTVVAILTLALGIGANVATFSIVYAVLLRPLPFPHQEQLVRVFDDLRGSNVPNVGMSVPSCGISSSAPACSTKSRSSGPSAPICPAATAPNASKLWPPARIISPCSERNRASAASTPTKMRSRVSRRRHSQ